MTKKRMRLFSIVLAVTMISSMLGVNAGAVEANQRYGKVSGISEYDGYDLYSADDGRYHLSISSVANKNTWSYPAVTVSINGTALAVSGRLINGTYYIPTRAAANVLGVSYSYDSTTKTATMSSNGLKMVMGAGCYVNYANERALFSMSANVIMSDGRMYIPAASLAKALGMKAEVRGGALELVGSPRPILHGDLYYRDDEVLWLSRIIHAEAEGEPLLGKIAVGNVVLNRVESSLYPNTIWGVIFDRKYGVQFSPVLNGTIYNTPDYSSVLAAKIALEGFDVTDGALFFLEPRLSTSSWIPKNREYSFTVGNHDFYN